MVKVTHNGLWYDFHSMKKKDRTLLYKAMFCGALGGFCMGVSRSDADLLMFSEIIHPSIYYVFPTVAVLSLLGAMKYGGDFYRRQDELFRSYHDFTLLCGWFGFAVFGLILHYLSIFLGFYVGWIEYLGCSVAGMAIGQLYFYKRHY